MPKLETYRSPPNTKGGLLRWRVKSIVNGRKISMSSEGYHNESDRRASIISTLEACEDWLNNNKE
jgi:hypothetical protein